MAKPKFNYDSEDFYKEIYALAMQGLQDAEIAYNLGDSLGVATDENGVPYYNDARGLSPEVFYKMKNGNYEGWTEEENTRRSARIRNDNVFYSYSRLIEPFFLSKSQQKVKK